MILHKITTDTNRCYAHVPLAEGWHANFALVLFFNTQVVSFKSRHLALNYHP